MTTGRINQVEQEQQRIVRSSSPRRRRRRRNPSFLERQLLPPLFRRHAFLSSSSSRLFWGFSRGTQEPSPPALPLMLLPPPTQKGEATPGRNGGDKRPGSRWLDAFFLFRVRRTQGRETTVSPDQNNGRGELPPGREPFYFLLWRHRWACSEEDRQGRGSGAGTTGTRREYGRDRRSAKAMGAGSQLSRLLTHTPHCFLHPSAPHPAEQRKCLCAFAASNLLHHSPSQQRAASQHTNRPPTPKPCNRD